MSRVSVRGIAVASATAVTAVGAVVGISGKGVQKSEAQTLDPMASTTTRLLDLPGVEQAEQLSDGVLSQADAQTAAWDKAQRVQAAEAARRMAAVEQAEAERIAREKAEQERREREERERAERERREREEAASRSEARGPVDVTVTGGDPREIARQMIPNDAQFQCFSNIVERESGWRVTATNPSSGAYGLVQALPGSKMASAGSDWRTNPATQIKWGLNYMNDRYDSPCGAWQFWQNNHWY